MIKILACGISKYREDGWDDLPFCVQDAKEFCKVFDENIITEQIINFSGSGEVTRKKYKDTLKKVSRSMTDKDILVYFHSGHGGIGEYIKKSYLELSDGKIYIEEVVNILNRAKAKAKIIILDACHSDIGAKYMPPISKDNIDDFCGKGIAILSSCKQNQTSTGSEEGSVFTRFLCDAVKSSCVTNERVLYFNDLQNLISIYARNYNIKNPKEQQIPVMRTSLIGTVAFPIRNYTEKIKPKELVLKTKKFDIINIKGSIKDGYLAKKRKFVKIGVVLKYDIEPEEIGDIIERVVNHLQENRKKIIEKRWKNITENPIEIVHMIIYRGYLDKEFDIYSYLGKWTLNVNDDNWHEKNKIKCTRNGYMSWQINENYDILKENKTGNIMPDEELIVFWNERIKTISESIARFDKKYHEYISEDISCNDLKKCAISTIKKIQNIYDECFDLGFASPFSRYKQLHKIGLEVAVDAMDIPQIFLSCIEEKQEFKGKMEIEWKEYYKRLDEWNYEANQKKTITKKIFYIIKNTIQKFLKRILFAKKL